MRKIQLFAAGLIGLAAAALSAPTHAMPASGAFAPAVDTLVAPVADYSVAPRRHWRYGYRHARPSRPYYAPYAYAPAYRYGAYAYDCCPACCGYGYYPAYAAPYAYGPLGRYYYPYAPRFYLRGFASPADLYYWW